MKRYYRFINSRPNRIKQLNDGLEVHHILPRSLGGSNNKENLIALTPREHYIAHLILVKSFPKGSIERRKMLGPLMFMSKRRTINSRLYEKLRQEQAESMSIRINNILSDPTLKEQWMAPKKTKEFKKLISKLARERYRKNPELRKLAGLGKGVSYKKTKSKIQLSETWGNHKKDLPDRPLCKRCKTNPATSAGGRYSKSTGEFVRKFRPRCHACDLELGFRKRAVMAS
jgi:hypothetical protein